MGRRRGYPVVPDDIGNYGSPAGLIEYQGTKAAIDPNVQAFLRFLWRWFLLRKAEHGRHRQETEYHRSSKCFHVLTVLSKWFLNSHIRKSMTNVTDTRLPDFCFVIADYDKPLEPQDMLYERYSYVIPAPYYFRNAHVRAAPRRSLGCRLHARVLPAAPDIGRYAGASRHRLPGARFQGRRRHVAPRLVPPGARPCASERALLARQRREHEHAFPQRRVDAGRGIQRPRAGLSGLRRVAGDAVPRRRAARHRRRDAHPACTPGRRPEARRSPRPEPRRRVRHLLRRARQVPDVPERGRRRERLFRLPRDHPGEARRILPHLAVSMAPLADGRRRLLACRRGRRNQPDPAAA